MSDDRYETTLDGPEDLLSGDEIKATGLGGITGVVRARYPGIFSVAVEFEDGRVESLSAFEAVTVLRRPLATVHPLIADVLSAHGFGR